MYYYLRNKLLKFLGITIYDDKPSPHELAMSFLLDNKDKMLNAKREVYLPNNATTVAILEYYKELEKQGVDIKNLMPVGVNYALADINSLKSVGDLYQEENKNDIADSLQYAIRTRCMPARPFPIDVYPESVTQHSHYPSDWELDYV